MMLTLPDEINEMLSPEMSKAEIKEIKDEVDAESKKTDIEVMLEKKDEVQQSLDDTLAKALYQWGKDTPESYVRIWTEAQRCHTEEITAEVLVNALAPGGFILIMTRIPGEGRCSVKIDENSEQVSVVLIRDGQRHTYSKADAAQVLMGMCGGSDAKEQWSELYNLAYPEPVKSRLHRCNQRRRAMCSCRQSQRKKSRQKNRRKRSKRSHRDSRKHHRGSQ